jgi:hypothetical protein
MEMYTTHTNYLPSAIINKAWRWQYLTHKKVATKIKVFFHELNREHTKIDKALWQ